LYIAYSPELEQRIAFVKELLEVRAGTLDSNFSYVETEEIIYFLCVSQCSQLPGVSFTNFCLFFFFKLLGVIL
jgi:hypothetical protein